MRGQELKKGFTPKEGGQMDDMKEFENDPDWPRAKMEAERKDPNYWLKRTIEEVEVHLRYGIPALKFIGWIIIILLGLILWRIWR